MHELSSWSLQNVTYAHPSHVTGNGNALRETCHEKEKFENGWKMFRESNERSPFPKLNYYQGNMPDMALTALPEQILQAQRK
jgi:hypothetical protein